MIDLAAMTRVSFLHSREPLPADVEVAVHEGAQPLRMPSLQRLPDGRQPIYKSMEAARLGYSTSDYNSMR